MPWMPLTPQLAKENLGFNVVGFITGSLGLGVAARNTVQAMDRHGLRFRVVDYHLGDDRSGHDESCLELGDQGDEPDPFTINVFHVNPPEARGTFQWGAIDLVDRFNVCVPFWELTVLPRDWVRILGAMDVVLAPTTFIRDIVREQVPDVTCLHYPQAALLPEGIEPDRAGFDLPDAATVFVSSFDVASDTNRKNPWGAVDAFLRAFPEPGNQVLVLKVNASSWSRETFPEAIERLHSIAAEHPNIRIIDRILPFEDVMRLYASCDVLVSLHRAEGLGLSLMEAMTLGKPIIATAWSGNMDFTTEANSCLVDFELIPVVSSHNSYSSRNVEGEPLWAEPDVAQAAEYMRSLDADADLRHRLGTQAAADMHERRDEYFKCRVWDELARMVLNSKSPLWSKHALRIDRLTRV